MKIVLNREYGGFCLPDEYAARKNIDVFEHSFEVRTDPELIEYLAACPYRTDLKVVEFPDEATDFDVLEYDGFDSLIYVLNGKIYYA